MLNGQEARISVGGKLGYLMTTATQTSTLQSVNFLDYGVVLTVLPIITEDGRVLMKVAPQVSTARINSTSKLPESEATEVSTNVMLNNGQAIVIGGLINVSATRESFSFVIRGGCARECRTPHHPTRPPQRNKRNRKAMLRIDPGKNP